MQNWIEKTKKIIEIIASIGGEARYVGGCVRDSIINRPVKDIDIATNLLPEQIIEVCKHHKIKTIPTGLKHGTITALIKGIPVEITTLRKDIVCDGRHADVAFTSSWFDDAKRRDFTFNALYADAEFNIFDYFEGQKDLSNRELNFVGNPEERITEDYLRILRAFRFHAALCTKPLSDIIVYNCQKYAANINILSGERISAEMFKLLSFPNAITTIKTMQSCLVLKEVINGENFTLSKINNNFISTIKDPVVKLAIILRTSNNPEIFPDIILKRWKISKKHYKELTNLVNFKDLISSKTIDSAIKEEAHFIKIESKSVSELNPKVFILNHGKEFFRCMLDVYLAEDKISIVTYNNLVEMTNNWDMPEFPISGEDVMSLGVASGKNVGMILNQLKDLWQKKECLITKEELINLAKKMI